MHPVYIYPPPMPRVPDTSVTPSKPVAGPPSKPVAGPPSNPVSAPPKPVTVNPGIRETAVSDVQNFPNSAVSDGDFFEKTLPPSLPSPKLFKTPAPAPAPAPAPEPVSAVPEPVSEVPEPVSEVPEPVSAPAEPPETPSHSPLVTLIGLPEDKYQGLLRLAAQSSLDIDGFVSLALTKFTPLLSAPLSPELRKFSPPRHITLDLSPETLNELDMAAEAWDLTVEKWLSRFCLRLVSDSWSPDAE